MHNPTLLVVAGVSGSGKTTVAQLLSSQVQNSSFIEADNYHPLPNKAKMQTGQPLNDEDRQPWLEALAHQAHKEFDAGKMLVVMACSMLKHKYRRFIRESLVSVASACLFVLIDPPLQSLLQHITGRVHFMPACLLQSQLETLEPGSDISLCITSSQPRTYATTPGATMHSSASSHGAATQGCVFVEGALNVFLSRHIAGPSAPEMAAGMLQLSNGETLCCVLYCDAFPSAEVIAAAICSWLTSRNAG